MVVVVGELPVWAGTGMVVLVVVRERLTSGLGAVEWLLEWLTLAWLGSRAVVVGTALGVGWLLSLVMLGEDADGLSTSASSSGSCG